jgi:hypothetical protein
MNARGEQTAGEQAFDRYWAALAHVEPRRCLLALLDRDRRIEVSVAVDDERLQTDRRVAMAEVHLPGLSELDLIDWDPETRRISKGPAFETIEPLLRAIDAEIGGRVEGVV